MNTFFKLFSISLLATSFTLTSCASIKSSKTRIIEYTSDANGFHTKTYFFEGENDVVAFDAQFTQGYAKKAIEHLRKFTNKPISWLVITHPNPDKFNGASVFQEEGAKIIASELTKKNMKNVHNYKKYYFVKIAKMFTEKTYPKMPKIDETFKTELTLRLSGGENIYLKELERAGISTNQTVAEIPLVKSLVVGDLVHTNAHAWLEGGIKNSTPKPTIDSWVELLIDLKNEYSSDYTVLGGRGKNTSSNKAFDKQITYLEKANKLVNNYVVGLGSKKSELKTSKSAKHYKAIAKIFEKEFPKYDLSYMIEYGVYGLINSKI